MRWGSAAVVAAATALALAGCTSTIPEQHASAQPRETAEISVPAVSAAADAAGTTEPVPQISVQITTEPPKPPGAKAKVAKSVTTASASYASDLVALANAARADAGLGKLAVNRCAQQQAVARAGRALLKTHLEHEPLPDCGFGYSGENLARHYGSPQAMHDAWMNSPGHRANILSPNYSGIGVGCVAYSRSDPQKIATTVSDIGGLVCAQVFVG